MAADDSLRRKLSDRFADFDADTRPDFRATILASARRSPRGPWLRRRTVVAVMGVLSLLLTASPLGDTSTFGRHLSRNTIDQQMMVSVTSNPATNKAVDRQVQRAPHSAVGLPENLLRISTLKVGLTKPGKSTIRSAANPQNVRVAPTGRLAAPVADRAVGLDLSSPGLPNQLSLRRHQEEQATSTSAAASDQTTARPTLLPKDTSQAGQTPATLSAAFATIDRLAIRSFSEAQNRPQLQPITGIPVTTLPRERLQAKQPTPWKLSAGVAPLLSYQAVTLPSRTGPPILIQNEAGALSTERTGYQAFVEMEKPLWPWLSVAASARYTHLQFAGAYAEWTGRYEADFSQTDTPKAKPEVIPIRTTTRYQAVSVRADLIYHLQTDIPFSVRVCGEYEWGLSQVFTTNYFAVGVGSWQRVLGQRIAIEPTFRYALRAQYGLPNTLVETRPYSILLSIRVPLN